MFLIKNQDGQYLASKPVEPVTRATRLRWLTFARQAHRSSTLEDATRFATNVHGSSLQVVTLDDAMRDDAKTYRNAPTPSWGTHWPPHEIEATTAGWPHLKWTKGRNGSVVIECDPWPE